MRFWDTLLNRGYPALFLIPIFKARSFEDRFRVPAQRASDAVYCVVPDNPTTRHLNLRTVYSGPRPPQLAVVTLNLGRARAPSLQRLLG